MSAVRFIHAADLHLDSPFKGLRKLPEQLFKRIEESTFASFKKVIDLAIRERVDFLLLSGDLYDGEMRSLRAQSRFRKEINRLLPYQIEVYIIHGNHDHLGGRWETLSWPEHVHFFESGSVERKTYSRIGKPIVHIYGFSYPERAVIQNMTSHYEKEPGAGFHIGMLHGNAEGNEEHDRYAPFTVKELLEKQFDYWALGHIHKRQVLHEQPPIVYPGNIQGRHRNEKGEKGCYLVELNENGATTTFHPTADIIWDEVVLSIENSHSVESLLEGYEQHKKGYRDRYKGVLLHLKLTGSGPLHDTFQQEGTMEDLVETIRDGEDDEDSFVWVNTYEIATTAKWEREQLKEDAHFIGAMLTYIDQYDGLPEALAPLYGSSKTRKYLESISEEEGKAILKEAEQLLLHHLHQED